MGVMWPFSVKRLRTGVEKLLSYELNSSNPLRSVPGACVTVLLQLAEKPRGHFVREDGVHWHVPFPRLTDEVLHVLHQTLVPPGVDFLRDTKLHAVNGGGRDALPSRLILSMNLRSTRCQGLSRRRESARRGLGIRVRDPVLKGVVVDGRDIPGDHSKGTAW